MISHRRRRADRAGRRLHEGRRRFGVETLELRQMLSNFTVTNMSDSGLGSLRQAIISADGVTGVAPSTSTSRTAGCRRSTCSGRCPRLRGW